MQDENIPNNAKVIKLDEEKEEPIPTKPHMKKAPHLRKITVCSPSDNLSPLSQKLMANDRVRGVKPKCLNTLLKKGKDRMAPIEIATKNDHDEDEGEEEDGECPPSPTPKQ